MAKELERVEGRRWKGPDDMARRPHPWRLAVAVGLATAAQCLVLWYVYALIGNATGYFERLHNDAAMAYTLPNGSPLAAEADRRLAARGVTLPLHWTTIDWGGTSTTIACAQPEGTVCLAFEFYRGRHAMEAGNPLAKQLFPELPVRQLPYGWGLDRVDESALDRVRRRAADLVLRAPSDGGR